MIKILIVDDHLLLREGIKCLLGTFDGLEIIAEAYDGEQALRVLNKNTNSFDIVLVDINMPKMNGIELIRRVVNSEQQNIRCIVLSAYVDESLVESAVQAGARGYVLKTATPEIIVEAINSVRNGGYYFHSAMTQKLRNIAEMTRVSSASLLDEQQKLLEIKSKEKKRRGRKRQTRLTFREIELLTMIAQGMGTKDIAYKLYLSEKTIKNHLTSIFRKLEVVGRTQAICAAVRQKIITVQ